jgi:hypothetical protein
LQLPRPVQCLLPIEDCHRFLGIEALGLQALECLVNRIDSMRNFVEVFVVDALKTQRGQLSEDLIPRKVGHGTPPPEF